jgi:acyl-CoA hydrolase
MLTTKNLIRCQFPPQQGAAVGVVLSFGADLIPILNLDAAPFGKPIAHGLLGLSLVAGLSSHYPSVRTLAFLKIDKWEFLKPIYIGDTVYAETEVTDMQLNGRRSGHVIWKRRLVNQAGDVLQSGTFRTLVSLARVHRKPQSTPQKKAEPALSSLPSNRAAG